MRSGVVSKSTLREQGKLEARRAELGWGSWGGAVSPYRLDKGLGSAVSSPNGVRRPPVLGHVGFFG